ncbi:MAG: DUF3369 domain-containing protein [Cyanobacteria bacterium REEB65]|nr:DUF3369 domain-containing protein [Cyanobacteria bacterium REEB65]
MDDKPQILDDDVLFAFEEGDSDDMSFTGANADKWKILVVDDDPDVHSVTKLALGLAKFADRGIELVSAFSAQEAEELLQKNGDAAVIFLDVVMEKEDSGLELVRFIRDVIQNRKIRIILRTGQPGQAPEEYVIQNYDINDYRSKTELTSQRLMTTLVSALRSFQDLSTIEQQRDTLSKIVRTLGSIFDVDTTEQLIVNILLQLKSLGEGNVAAAFVLGQHGEGPIEDSFHVQQGIGRFGNASGKSLRELVPPERLEKLKEVFLTGESQFHRNEIAFFVPINAKINALIYVEVDSACTEWDYGFTEVLLSYFKVAYDNLKLNHDRAMQIDSFGRFVPRELLKRLGYDELTRVRAGQKIECEMTVLFMDILSFTPLTEGLAPKAAFEMVNEFLGEVGPAIMRNGGIIDKFMGDGVMVVFPESPVDALKASIEIRYLLGFLNEQRQARQEAPIEVGIGIHCGSMVLGTLGFSERMETTVISDTVNIAARLEQTTRAFGANVLISAEVASHLPDDLRPFSRLLGRFFLKGKAKSIDVIEFFASDAELVRTTKLKSKPELEAAVNLLCRQDFEAAAAALERLKQRFADDAGIRLISLLASQRRTHLR